MESGPDSTASNTDELAELEFVLFDVQYSLPLQSYLQYFKDNYDSERAVVGKLSESDSNSITQYLKLRVEITHRWNRLNQKQRQELIHIYRYIKEIDEIIRKDRLGTRVNTKL